LHSINPVCKSVNTLPHNWDALGDALKRRAGPSVGATPQVTARGEPDTVERLLSVESRQESPPDISAITHNRAGAAETPWASGKEVVYRGDHLPRLHPHPHPLPHLLPLPLPAPFPLPQFWMFSFAW